MGKIRIDAIKEKTLNNNDGLSNKLNALDTLICHKSCYSTYTSVSRNSYRPNKRKSINNVEYSPNKRVCRSYIANDFVFRRDCFICGLKCEEKDPRHPDRWKLVRKCETDKRPNMPTFKETVLQRCYERDDAWGKQVELRVLGAHHDLPAAFGQYHDDCWNNFRRVTQNKTQSQLGTFESLDIPTQNVVKVMQRNISTTWLVSELYNIYLQNGGVHTQKTMMNHINEYFLEDILVIHMEGCSTIVGFKQYVSKTLKIERTTSTCSEVNKVQRLIRSEVDKISKLKDYDLGSFRYEQCVEDTSPTLLKFVSALVSNGKISKKSLSLSQSIQQHINGRNQTSLGLAIKLHHHYGSSQLIETLESHGFISSYSEVIHFRKSTAKYSSCQPRCDFYKSLGLKTEIGPIFAWADNFDLKVYSPNGRKETHAMVVQFMQHPAGIIETGSAKPNIHSVIIPRLKISEARNIKVSDQLVDILHHSGPKKVNPPPLKRQPMSLTEIVKLSMSCTNSQKRDVAWWKQLVCEKLPVEWSGFNCNKDHEEKKPIKPKTVNVHGPLIDLPPAHPDTVLTVMDLCKTTLLNLGMKYAQLDLDMQLYAVSCQIHWSDVERWTQLIIKPGMMHTLMSFCGVIGHFIKGTGAEELISAAFGCLTSILNGKSWPNAMRAFRMLTSAVLHDFVSQCKDLTYEKLYNYLEECRNHPTGKLWVDGIIKPTMLAHELLRAEREGDWLHQRHCLKKMLPYFFSAGHHWYARYITWYLLQMDNLPPEAKIDLLNGAHVCRHSDSQTSISADQFGEMTYIRQGKGAGGLKGISTSKEQVAEWVACFPVCSYLSESLEEMYLSPSVENKNNHIEKHKEEGEKRKKIDNEDRNKILEKLNNHSHPLKPSNDLYNIINGKIASHHINVHECKSVGEKMSQNFYANLPSGFHNKISGQVKTMEALKKNISVNGVEVYDLEAIFSRLLIIGSQRQISLDDLFTYELSPVSPSLIDEYGCLRTGTKSTLVTKLKVEVHEPLSYTQTSIIIDGSQLLYHVNWPLKSTVAQLVSNIKESLLKYNEASSIDVIFDRYDGISAKDHERFRRAGDGSQCYNLLLNNPLPARNEVLKNRNNKKKLISLICSFPATTNSDFINPYDSISDHDEADISIITYMLKAVEDQVKNIIIKSDDTDIFVLAVYWYYKKSVKSSVYMEKWDGTILDICKTVEDLGPKCSNLLAIHALTGCDTVSAPFGKGKCTAINVMRKNNFPDLDIIFGNQDVTKDRVISAGKGVLLQLYGQDKASSMNEARLNIFRKSKITPALKSLPPTDNNLVFHCLRAQLQVILWKAADVRSPPAVDICDYGWYIQEIKDANGKMQYIPQPLVSKMDTAPPGLMDVISCNCKSEKSCVSKQCSCHKMGLTCTYYCKCNGKENCYNPFTTPTIEELSIAEEDDMDNHVEL